MSTFRKYTLLGEPVFSKPSVHSVIKSCMGKTSIQRERQIKIYWSTKCRLEREEYPRNKQQHKCPRTGKFLVDSSTLIEGTKIERVRRTW